MWFHDNNIIKEAIVVVQDKPNGMVKVAVAAATAAAAAAGAGGGEWVGIDE